MGHYEYKVFGKTILTSKSLITRHPATFAPLPKGVWTEEVPIAVAPPPPPKEITVTKEGRRMQGITKELVGDVWVMHADSLVAFQELASEPSPVNRNNWLDTTNRTRYDERFESLSWYGVAGGRQEVRQILASGEWQAGVRRMEEAFGDLDAPIPVSARRNPRWTDQGDELDIHRVYSGQLERAWRRSGPRRRVANRNISIMVNVGVSAGMHSDTIFWRGASALKLADTLTQAGYNVEVMACYTCYGITPNRNRKMALTATVKDARAPLDINALAVCCCLPAFFRYAMFQAMTACPELISSGLGFPANYRNVVTPEMDGGMSAIVCEGMNNKEQAEEWLRKAIAKIEDVQAEEVA